MTVALSTDRRDLFRYAATGGLLCVSYAVHELSQVGSLNADRMGMLDAQFGIYAAIVVMVSLLRRWLALIPISAAAMVLLVTRTSALPSHAAFIVTELLLAASIVVANGALRARRKGPVA